MLDIVNEQLVEKGEEPIAFESDCREGICGTCSLTISGEAHGPDHPGAACQLYMRRFKDGETITVEPFRARSFPLVRDLVVNRTALDRIVQAGGYVSARSGSAPEANSISGAETRCRSRDGSRGLHWLRRLCGRLPERLGHALHLGEGLAPRVAAAG